LLNYISFMNNIKTGLVLIPLYLEYNIIVLLCIQYETLILIIFKLINLSISYENKHFPLANIFKYCRAQKG
ncbi:hypothetical protein, partial [Peptostreptococcus sp.]|uniref:hypothetical protein n=1 Tax=Peptostreptococcus sp. TaxID=1262 RepID=UPI0025F629FF